MLRKPVLTASAVLFVALFAGDALAYPLDAYEDTGIRRLEFYRLGQLEIIKNVRKVPPGGALKNQEIRLNKPTLVAGKLPAADPQLSKELSLLLAEEDRERYSIALLDFTDPQNPVLASHNGAHKSNVGSVGKLLAGLALYDQLAKVYPKDIEKRKAVLRNTRVIADQYARGDHHKVPFFDVAERTLSHRPLIEGDSASLWEYLDFMYSASSNSAGSMVIQQALLLSHFREKYPVSEAEKRAWLDSLGWAEEGELMRSIMLNAVTDNGLDSESLRQLSYFTRQGKRESAGGKSIGTALELVKFLALMERGELVDEWTSLDMKKQMYMTQKRIRYASHPNMGRAAMYFKSGSLYSCKKEPGFICRKYRGNRKNILASVAIVESPSEYLMKPPADQPPIVATAATPMPLRYAVAVVSNVLYKNSAIAHQQLAYKIHRLIERHNAAPSDLDE